MPQANTTTAKAGGKTGQRRPQPVRGFNPRSLKVAEQARKTPRWKLALMSLLGLGAAGCTEIDVVNLPPAQGLAIYDADRLDTLWPVDASHQQRLLADLQLCTNHIARGLYRDQSGFTMLRLDQDSLLDQPWHGYVGGTPVARTQTGTGDWYGGLPGRASYRKVVFHCLQAENGQILYSYVKPQ